MAPFRSLSSKGVNIGAPPVLVLLLYLPLQAQLDISLHSVANDLNRWLSQLGNYQQR